MQLIGERVNHKTFGSGSIIEQNKTTITVRFPERDIKFVYPSPDTFTKFLTAENPDLQSTLAGDPTPDQKNKDEALKRQRAAWAAKQERDRLEQQRLEEQRKREQEAKIAADKERKRRLLAEYTTDELFGADQELFTVDETAKKPLPVANIETEEKVDANYSPKESEEGIAKSEVHAASVGIDESANAEPVFVSRNQLLIDKQFRKSVPREKRAICEKKIEELVRALDEGTEHTFLHNNDGKPMKGAKNVYKFRATHADRIIYVHTEDVPHLKDRYPDSIVLLRYADHDEQGSVAARVDLNSLRISEERRKKAYQTDFRFTDETSQRDCDEYFSEMVSNVINISQLKSYISTSEENYDVLLNEEQYEVLNSGAFPLIIYGCAGSGKTVLSTHLIYGFIKSGYDSRALYTSLSENLNTHVQKLFANIAKADEPEAYRDYKADFLEVNALFRRLTGAHKSEFSDFIRFKELCRTNTEAANKLKRLAKDNIDILAVWSEIRGIIKGHLDENWGWSSPISRTKLQDAGIRFLTDYGLIKANDPTHKYYVKVNEAEPISEWVECLLEEENLSVGEKQKILASAKIIDSHFSEFDSSKRMLNLEEYLVLNSEYSVYDKAQRTVIHELCVLYDNWLVENKLYDDNDLARRVIDLKSCEGQYDFAVLDEVQDLTEMQIYALYKICKNPSYMVFAGDIHQVINPTFFSEERIRKLYYSRNRKRSPVHISFLKKNYRSQDKIVDFANELAEIRKRRIGSRSLQSELSEESAIEGWRPFLLNASESNIKQIVNRVNELPYAAIVVQDRKHAGMLLEMLDSEYAGNIFTVQEIKGLEKRYVVCIDVASAYSQEWADIFSEKNIRKNMKYRYYFNTLYVAATRAQDGLCFVERSLPESMQDWLLKFADYIDDYDSDRLFLDDDDSAGEHWYQSANKLQENQDYERAILQYKKSQFEDFALQITRCEVKLLLQQGKINDAIKCCTDNDAFELLELIANDTDDTEIEKFCRGCAAIMVQESLEGTRTVLNYAENALRDDSLTCKLVRKISETTVYALMAATERLNKEMPDE